MQNVPKKKHAVRRHSRILLLIFAVVLVAAAANQGAVEDCGRVGHGWSDAPAREPPQAGEVPARANPP